MKARRSCLIEGNLYTPSVRKLGAVFWAGEATRKRDTQHSGFPVF